jgi:hypothetical protein
MLANGVAGMRLWTYHPAGFAIDDPLLSLDSTKGRFWNLNQQNFAYRDALIELRRFVGKTNFLWFCTKSPNTFNTRNDRPDRIEWEIEIPIGDVLVFVHSPTWERILRRDDGDNWRDAFSLLLLLDPTPENVGESDVDALVELPLPPRCVIQTHRVPTDAENRARRRRSVTESRQ